MAALGQAKQYSSSGQMESGAPPPPKRPRVEPYHDAISRSAQHYDLFEMIRNPHPSSLTRPPDPPAPGALYEASLSKQFKIRRELEKQFYSSSGVMASTAKVVRFFFMILFLPIYMIGYRLPAWLLGEYLPKIIKIGSDLAVLMGKRIANVMVRAGQAIKRPFIRLWEAMVREVESGDQPKVDDEHLDFFAFVAHGFVLLYLQIYAPLKKAVIVTGEWTVKTAYTMYEFPGKVRDWTNEKLNAWHRWKQNLKGKIKARIHGMIHDLHDATIGRYKRFLTRLRNVRETTRERLLSLIPSFEFPRIKHAVNYVKERYNQFRLPKLTLPVIKMPAIVMDTRERYLNLRDGLVAAYKSFRKFEFNISINWPKLPKISLPKLDWKTPVMNAIHSVKQSVLATIRYPIALVSKPVVAAGAPVVTFLKKNKSKVTTIKPAFKLPNMDFLNPYLQPIKDAKAAVVMKVETVSMHVRFFIAWTHILVRYGIAQVKEFADNLI